MEFRRTNRARRAYLLQRSLYGDFTAGWNGVRTNSMGHLLPARGIGVYDIPRLDLAGSGVDGGFPSGYPAAILFVGS